MQLFLKDECGQGSAEYILLFGAIIVIAIAALLIYRSYFQKSSLNAAQDIGEIRNHTNGTTASSNTPTNNTNPNPPSWP